MTFHAACYDGRLGLTAQDDRQLLAALTTGSGVFGTGDLAVSAGSGMNSNIAAGHGAVPNIFQTQGGSYLVRNDAPVAVTHAPNTSGSDRVDRVFVQVFDSESGGDSSDTTTPVILPIGVSLGTHSLLLLATVTVHSGDSSSASFTYTDARTFAGGITPWVPFVYAGGASVGSGFTPGARLENGVVRLRGEPASGGGTITIPTFARPSVPLSFAIIVGGSLTVFTIPTSGQIAVGSSTLGLDGMTYTTS